MDRGSKLLQFARHAVADFNPTTARIINIETIRRSEKGFNLFPWQFGSSALKNQKQLLGKDTLLDDPSSPPIWEIEQFQYHPPFLVRSSLNRGRSPSEVSCGSPFCGGYDVECG